MCVVLKYSEHRDDYEIIDKTGKCRGFVWRYKTAWVCRVDNRTAEYRDSYEDAAVLARQIVKGDCVDSENVS